MILTRVVVACLFVLIYTSLEHVAPHTCFAVIVGLVRGKALVVAPLALVDEWLCVVVVAVIFVFQRSQQSDDVTFKPREQEVRQLVLKNEPSQLHKVDAWMEGDRNLLAHLRDEYATTRNLATIAIR